MARAVAGLLIGMALASVTPTEARGHHGGGLFGHVRHGHPINAWMGSRRVRFR